MKTQELVHKLRDYANGEEAHSRSQSAFARYLAGYVEQLDLAYYEKFSDWDIISKLPQIIVGAISEIQRFRATRPETDSATTVTSYDLLTEFDDMEQQFYVLTVHNVVRGVTGSKELVEHVDKVLRPEWHAIHAAFFRFLDTAYARGGLEQKIRDSYPRAVKLTFGETSLRGVEFIGRISLRFERGDGPDARVAFICDTEDKHGYSGGMAARDADLATTLAMINEVTDNWPEYSPYLTGKTTGTSA